MSETNKTCMNCKHVRKTRVKWPCCVCADPPSGPRWEYWEAQTPNAKREYSAPLTMPDDVREAVERMARWTLVGEHGKDVAILLAWALEVAK